jgi:hypothetical protein
VDERRLYDTWRGCGLALSFKCVGVACTCGVHSGFCIVHSLTCRRQWKELNVSRHAQHWVSNTSTTLTIPDKPHHTPAPSANDDNKPMTREEMLRAFRSYKI